MFKRNKKPEVDPAGRCLYCGAQVHFSDRRCPKCKKPNDLWVTPTDKQCGNCGAWLNGDLYCRYCGTKAGEGRFDPYQNLMECIYGPMPVKRTHRCGACGYEWTTCLMLDDEKYCPKCGAQAPVVQEAAREEKTAPMRSVKINKDAD